MSLKDQNLIILDLQTTGFVPRYSQIVEMAWAKVEGRSGQLTLSKVDSSIVELPEGTKLTRGIREITGLSDEDFVDAKPLEQLTADLSKKAIQSKTPLLSHYARFEKSFLDVHGGEEFLEAQFFCTFEIAKRLYPDLPCRNLPALAGYFGHPHLFKKRAASHVVATYIVWKSIVDELETNLGITNFTELSEWLEQKPTREKTKTKFLIPKSVRDEIPAKPGVYQFLNRNQEILYIGKAINLKQRLKSYFQISSLRGRKKEMMTQAAELKYQFTESEIHAALLESDLIKQHSPPYNVALQNKGRGLYFFSRDYLDYSDVQDSDHPYGPYTQPQDFAGFQALVEKSSDELVSSLMFYGFVSVEEFVPGWELFKEKYLMGVQEYNMRTFLALGLKFYRFFRNQEDEASSEDELKEEQDEVEDRAYTPEEICQKLERRLAGLARQYLRSQAMTLLLNSVIQWDEKEGPCRLCFRDGRSGQAQSEMEASQDNQFPWSGKDISDYDRVRVLLTELLTRFKRGDQIQFETLSLRQYPLIEMLKG